MWTQELFGVEKLIIALLHLDVLPGDPGYCCDMETVLVHARQIYKEKMYLFDT